MSSKAMVRKEFIDSLNSVLAVKRDFEKLNYTQIRNGEVVKDYISLRLVTGDAFTFDVTDCTDEQIYHALALLECGQVSSRLIRDKEELIKIAMQSKEWGSLIY